MDKMDKKKAQALDKYYTNNDVALECYKKFKEFLDNEGITDYTIVEPSAGGGSFYNAIESDKLGFDLLPECDGVIKHNFVEDDLSPYFEGKRVVFLGNPPFGKKGNLAIEFINKCLEYGDYVGFILPLQFRKYSTHKNINAGISLVLDCDIDENSFNIVGNPYSIRSSFQIWANGLALQQEYKDLRISTKPQTKTDLFTVYQYNRTDEALKYFDYNWDFAVHRQGHYDFNKIYLPDEKEAMDRKRQFAFIKANSKEVLDNLLALDYDTLSKQNAVTPGFGIADIISAYYTKYGEQT